jgi:YhcH/YjgK/YiaL family protein
MIKDTLNNAYRYYGLGENIKMALEFMQKTDFTKMADGKYELSGKKVYYLVERYDTVPISDTTEFEAHGVYLDIQFFVSGHEVIPHQFIERLKVKEPFDAEQDGATFFYDKNASLISYAPGDIAFFFPNDAHSPRGAVGGVPKPVNKVVFKVKL